jgi:hypothetical protein
LKLEKCRYHFATKPNEKDTLVEMEERASTRRILNFSPFPTLRELEPFLSFQEQEESKKKRARNSLLMHVENVPVTARLVLVDENLDYHGDKCFLYRELEPGQAEN